MSQATHCLYVAEADGNARPKSFDFRGAHELDWDAIEIEIYHMAVRAEAVEFLGRTAVDSIHGAQMRDAFDLVATDIADHIDRLKTLLGLTAEGGQQP